MIKKYFVTCLILLIVLSCNKVKISKNENTIIFDSIKAPEGLEDSCSVSVKGYKKKFGVILSNYFEISDQMFYDINKDEKIDTLLVLTPASMIPGEKGNSCNRADLDDRLLVVLFNLDGKKSKINIFKNIISNQISVAWQGSEEFGKYKNGFKLQKSSGQGCKFDYSIFVNTTNKRIIIDSISLSSFCPSSNNKEKNIQFFKTKDIRKFNRKMIDSIKMKYDL